MVVHAAELDQAAQLAVGVDVALFGSGGGRMTRGGFGGVCVCGLSPKSWPRIRREADWDTDVNAVTILVFPGDLDQFLKFQRSLFKDERGWRFAGRAGVSNPGVEID